MKWTISSCVTALLAAYAVATLPVLADGAAPVRSSVIIFDDFPDVDLAAAIVGPGIVIAEATSQKVLSIKSTNSPGEPIPEKYLKVGRGNANVVVSVNIHRPMRSLSFDFAVGGSSSSEPSFSCIYEKGVVVKTEIAASSGTGKCMKKDVFLTGLEIGISKGGPDYVAIDNIAVE